MKVCDFISGMEPGSFASCFTSEFVLYQGTTSVVPNE